MTEAASATNTKPTAGITPARQRAARREQRQASGIGGDVQSGDGSRRRGGTDVGLDVGGGAFDLFAALLPVRERVLGAGHPDTLTTRHHLAHWTTQAAASDG
jgi:hypothetical protein